MATELKSASENAGPSRVEQVRIAIDEFLARRASGEAVTAAQWIESHGGLMPELGEELRKLALIDGARRMSSAIDDTLVVLRCPQCRHALQLEAELLRAPPQCGHCGALVHRMDRASDRPPTRLGHFQLLGQLGAGSFGTVWRARDTVLGREVALKIPRQSHQNQEEIAELMREACLTARVKHPRIVAIHAIGQDGDWPYIVSDLISGMPLHLWAAQLPPGFEQVARLCAEIAEALEHAHRAGVIHRDLKPANILIDERGQPHLTDFGLALRLTGEITLTDEGQILGTPAYMSPEQARGDSHRCDARSDIYSLGVILYELLTDELPFRGNSLMLVDQLIHDQPLAPRRLNRFIPRDLETICLKCLEKSPAQRYQSAQDFAEDLGRYLRSEPTFARPVGRWGKGVRWCRRKPALAAALASIALLLTLIVAGAVGGYLHERAQRIQLNRLWAFINQSSDVQLQRQVVEAAAAELAGSRAGMELAASPSADSHPQLQAWVDERMDQSATAGHSSVFAWFALDALGTQLARGPWRDTVGRRYAHRAYYHGGEHDYSPAKAPRAGQHITRTHVSPVFETEHTRQWVVAVSTPVLKDGEFVGVVGVFLQLEPPSQPSANSN